MELTQEQFESTLRQLLEVLNDDEKRVLKNRYGLDMPALSIKKAAKELGMSVSTIRSIEKNALKKLKETPLFVGVAKKLQGKDLNSFMTNGVSGYFLLAIQILR